MKTPPDDGAHPELRALDERLGRVLQGPSAIESQTLFKIARPLLSIAKWRATMKVDAAKDLIERLRDPEAARAASLLAFGAALRELEANVLAVERVAIVRQSSPIAHAAWLRRVVGLLEIAHRALEVDDTNEAKVRAWGRMASRVDPSALSPPLVTVTAKAPTALDLPSVAREVDADDVRLVDLELATIDHLFAAARAETLLLGRRRRLLIAARQRLLDAAAALPLDRAGIRERTAYVAKEITRLDRLEAAGLDPDVSLLHQARQALTRRDPGRLFASISALEANAISAADRSVAQKTGEMMSRISRAEDQSRARAASFSRSGQELLGDVAPLIRAAVAETRAAANMRMSVGGVPSEREAAKALLTYLPADADEALVRATIAADGLFEVGGALTAVRVQEEERVMRLVKHPTPSLVLQPAEDVQDLRDAVINDPRSILLDLATGRLFARRFVREEVRRSSRVIMRGEVRVYVLDGSGSMKGPRARVRDSILIAELSTLMSRLAAPGETRCTLFYRYFTAELGLVTRVDSIKAAKEAIRDVVSNARSGGTDIQKALLASLDQIAEARANDPELARAQIVLVTDGEAAVEEGAIVAARAALQGFPIGISVIALGQENPALREIVARQRAKGEAAFYHFLEDGELESVTSGLLDQEESVHAPRRWSKLETEAELTRALEEDAGALLDDLEHLDRERDRAALERIEEEVQARREVGLVEETRESDQARIEALRRDRVALAARFDRWFPRLEPGLSAPSSEPVDEDVEATVCTLISVAEVTGLLGGSEMARQADAIELFERLLPDARLTPSRYRAVLREHPELVRDAVGAVRDAARGVSASPLTG